MKASCSICNGRIAGRKNQGAKTRHSTSRKFPELCATCLSRIITDSVRVREGFKNLDEVDIVHRTYVQGLLK